MTVDSTLTDEGTTLVVSVPYTHTIRGGRRMMLAPDNIDVPSQPAASPSSTLIKAVARAHRWAHLLEAGKYATASELAKAEGVNLAYLCRLLRLTLLAPAITEAILDGRITLGDSLEALTQDIPREWERQKANFSQQF